MKRLPKILLLALFLLIPILANSVVYVVNNRDVQNRGGCWTVPKRTAFTTYMDITQLTTSNLKTVGSAILSTNYYTLVQVDSSQDSVYTLGIDSTGAFPDSAISGTGWTRADTTCLDLSGFLGENIQVGMYVYSTAACSIMVTVEQSLRFNRTLADSGFNYGFVVTDTLFTDRMVTTLDTLYVSTVSLHGEQSRIFTDWFDLVAPMIRLKIKNRGKIATPGIGIELYCTHNNQLMSGSSGRLQQSITDLK